MGNKKNKNKKETFDRKILFDFLQTKYGISKLPKHFFIKMSNIFNGKLKGLSKPIPPEHMYDMWIQKSNYLDKVYANNISKGKKMDGYLRLNYDLAILISKYDSYLSWLDKQKAEEMQNENIKANISVTKVLYNKQDNSIKNDDDIADILDDLM